MDGLMNIILNRRIRHDQGFKQYAMTAERGQAINLGTLKIQVKEPLRC